MGQTPNASTGVLLVFHSVSYLRVHSTHNTDAVSGPTVFSTLPPLRTRSVSYYTSPARMGVLIASNVTGVHTLTDTTAHSMSSGTASNMDSVTAHI